MNMQAIDPKLDKELKHLSAKSYIPETRLVNSFIDKLADLEILEEQISLETRELVKKVKADNSTGSLVEEFLNKYNLSTNEGIAIIMLAESLLRVKDDKTKNALVLDKLAISSYKKLTDGSNNFATNAWGIGLYFSAKFANLGLSNKKPVNLIYRLGSSGFVYLVSRAISMLSRQFILAENIESAHAKLKKSDLNNYKFCFNLCPEPVRNYHGAEENYNKCLEAIKQLNSKFPIKFDETAEDRHSLAIKLSSLHPRLEYLKQEELEEQLVPNLITLIKTAEDNKIAITFEAEEYSKTDIYLKLITRLAAEPKLSECKLPGVVVQAHSRHSEYIIDYLAGLAKKYDSKIPVRLIKGIYWEHEIKRAQELGIEEYPVFTRKEFTDLSYLACSKKIMANIKYLKPQFASHNPQTITALKKLIKNNSGCEFQRLYGRGARLYSGFGKTYKTRIYTPLASPEELSSYLVRRIIEAESSSSPGSIINDPSKNGEEIVYSLLSRCETLKDKEPYIMRPKELYMSRQNSTGIDSGVRESLEKLEEEIKTYYDRQYNISPIIKGKENFQAKNSKELFRPAKKSEKIGATTPATSEDMLRALDYCNSAFESWSSSGLRHRANILREIARLYEENQAELLSILIKESGKSINDAIDEIREAVDFCRYYSNKAVELMSEKTLPGPTGEKNLFNMTARGSFVCISPWNFPLAVFTGQIVAALVAGNSVIAKPAEESSIIASKAIKLMHEAGVPKEVLHMLNAPGSLVSKYLLSNDNIAGVAFTGSKETSKAINNALAERTGRVIPFIAETSGNNAMIVDSSAQLEQVTDDVILSAFYSAGQRCSSLRVLYAEEEIYEQLIDLLKGAMECLKIGDTKELSNDIGPVIDEEAAKNLNNHIEDCKNKGYKVHNSITASNKNTEGYFVYPHIIELNDLRDLEQEVFGPILHIIPYKSDKLDEVIQEVNTRAHSLTFGIHSRIESRINYIKDRVRAGNIYVNRSIISARVESQPFGGEGFSGTGFKSGGPNYLLKFLEEKATSINLSSIGSDIELLNQAGEENNNQS
jgi:RHH-type proline utilization regulon transcriptional repressor/proline dehydrogenase/delta 1-pyrroline-5-carboxylate dehydrogenase